MIASPSQLEDKKARLLMLEAMEICLRVGAVDKAKEIGQASATLKKQIDTKDYSREDNLLKTWKQN